MEKSEKSKNVRVKIEINLEGEEEAVDIVTKEISRICERVYPQFELKQNLV